eukprot:jgi/Mesvir1/10130/Mv06763-RA.1
MVVLEAVGSLTLEEWISKQGARPAQEVVTVDQQTRLQEALDIMLEKHLTSIPVTLGKPGSYAGFLDTLDVVAVFTGIHLKKLNRSVSFLRDHKHVSHSKIQHLTWETEVKDAVNLSSLDPFIAFHGNTSMRAVAEKLVQGVHRVAVLGPGEKIVRIVTQSDMVRVLNTLPVFIEHPKTKRTLEEIGLAGKGAELNIETVTPDTPAIEAFTKMMRSKQTAIPLVDEDGLMVATLSASDIRLMAKRKNYELLDGTALEFVSYTRQHAEMGTAGKGGKTFPAAIACSPTSTLLDCAHRFAATGVHQLYVLGPGHILLGCVTLTDLLAALCQP